MQNFTKIFVFSVIYLVLYNIPLISFKNAGLTNWPAFVEIVLLIPALFIIFSLIFILPRFLAIPVVMLLFLIGGIATYYLVNFGKTFDNGIIIDLLSVEKELIAEYVSWSLIAYIFVSLFIPIILEFILTKYPVFVGNKIIIGFQLLCLIFVILYNVPQKLDYLGRLLLTHPPFKHLYVTGKFFTKYHSRIKQTDEKLDLTKKHKTEFTRAGSKPLIVVLVIGESMRGDINSLNGYTGHENMPLMASIPNLVSFPKAQASATSTRIALPYILTNAIPPNFDAATSTKGVISIFKNLGFKTSWIGNQGLFGYYDTDYASNALESDFILSKDDLRIHLNQTLIYDESLLPYIRNRINEVENNHFLVVHLIGSHWQFGQRYPASFGHKFMPVCESYLVSECSNQEILNSYHNTIAYTDYVLDLILQELAGKNAILLYASDHGFSLNEQGMFGNAALEPIQPKEQLTIEMFSWLSGEFLKNNKNFYDKILKNKNKNISHNYIFHSLLDCAGVKADFIDQTLSICN